MSLKSFVIARSIIGDPEDPTQNFSVRGLNLNDLTRLLIDHAPAMMKLYADFVATKDGKGPSDMFTSEMVKDMLRKALGEAPELIFGLIAYASDEPDEIELASKLPVILQLEAMEQIVLLSIRSEAELKKLQEMVLRIIETVAVQVGKWNLPVTKTLSDLGYGKSASA